MLTFAKVDESSAKYIFGGAYKIVGFDPNFQERQHYVLEYDVLVDKLYIEDENQNYGAIKRLFENLEADVYFA